MKIEEQIATIERTLKNSAIGESVKTGLRKKLDELKSKQLSKDDSTKKEPSGDKPTPFTTGTEIVYLEDSPYDDFRIDSMEWDESNDTWKYTSSKGITHFHSILEKQLDEGKIKIKEKSTTIKDIQPDDKDRPKNMSQLKKHLKNRRIPLYVIKKDNKGNYQAYPKLISKVQTKDFELEDALTGRKSWVEFGKAKDMLINPMGFKLDDKVTFMYDKKDLPSTIEQFVENLESMKEPSKTKSSSKPEKTSKKYKLGDMYSSDFDYDGMIKMYESIDDSWSKSDLEKLRDSLEDVNYHSEAKKVKELMDSMSKGSDPKKQKDLTEKEVQDLISIAFDKKSNWSDSVWRKAVKQMNKLIDLGYAKPHDYGRGKGKYTTTKKGEDYTIKELGSIAFYGKLPSSSEIVSSLKDGDLIQFKIASNSSKFKGYVQDDKDWGKFVTINEEPYNGKRFRVKTLMDIEKLSEKTKKYPKVKKSSKYKGGYSGLEKGLTYFLDDYEVLERDNKIRVGVEAVGMMGGKLRQDTFYKSIEEFNRMRSSAGLSNIPDMVKIGGEIVSCDDLIEEERKKIEKRRKTQKKRSKVPEPQKNLKRIRKATESIEDSLKERLKEGKSISKSEIDKLIKECEDLLKKLKKYLKELQK